MSVHEFCSVSDEEGKLQICFAGPEELQVAILRELRDAGFPSFDDDQEEDDEEEVHFILTGMPRERLIPLLLRHFEEVEDLSPVQSCFYLDTLTGRHPCRS